ncbi:unnamed protein product [Lactuca saligna]|uniref:Uncharacterized protein n=1 Tax=Lactuca saligna TaxID=75948 RepID=A0AA35ZT72_LACSI|nr:unnamed protein product [Lactuca saligna]
MLTRVDPTNTILVTYLQTIDTSVETRVLLEREKETKSKCLKKTTAESSEKQVKESKSTKSPKKLPITEPEPTKPEVSHQGLLFCEIPAPASPSSKMRRETDMGKHISKNKKKSKVIISSESTADENETVPETPEADLQK